MQSFQTMIVVVLGIISTRDHSYQLIHSNIKLTASEHSFGGLILMYKLHKRPIFFSSELFYLTSLVHQALLGEYTPLTSQRLVFIHLII